MYVLERDLKSGFDSDPGEFPAACFDSPRPATDGRKLSKIVQTLKPWDLCSGWDGGWDVG